MVRVFVNSRYYGDMPADSSGQVSITIAERDFKNEPTENPFGVESKRAITFSPFVCSVIENDGKNSDYAFINEDCIEFYSDNKFYLKPKPFNDAFFKDV